jgi:UDP-N-acetylglucosamine--N-acetylmuramyl-(pentapeptide) pyrophosphoryl-undecaprenol N-acetylglucosamine transferase
MNFFKLKKDHKVILIIGGSLGAKSINEGILSTLDVIKDKPVQLLWQVGKRYQEKIENELQHTKVDNVLNRAFIKRMDLAYAAADLVISRAGALSISEITLIGKPSILIPSPNVSEDHQTKNALSLVNQNAALLIKDDEAKKALESAVKLIDDTNQMDVISSNAKSMGKPNATKDIVVEISKLGEKF